MNEKIEALAKFLEVEVEEIEQGYNDDYFEVNGEEYLVVTDEEADNYFHDSEENLINELGIEAFSDCAKDYIIDNFINSEWFDDCMNESNEIYCNDIETESASSDEFENRLEEEMAENDCETMEDYVEFMNNQYYNGIEWYKDNFGDKEFSEVAIKYGALDVDGIIDWIKDEDGRGGCLTGYDGIENEQDNYFIYRTN